MHNLSEPFIKRPIMTSLVMVAVVFFGIFSYINLPVSDLPNVDFPTIQVTTSYPGADPETMANNVTSPLEKKFLTIDDISTITSTSTTGSSTIVLQFGIDKSMDAAAQDVQAAINQASQQLPQDLPYSPTYIKANPSATPVMYLCLSSPTLPLNELYKYADSIIAQRINIAEGVSQVSVYGSPFAVRVQIDPNKVAALGLSIEGLSHTIKGNNSNQPTGNLYGPELTYTINVDGQIPTAEGYNNLIILNDEGAVTRLQDIGMAINSISSDKLYTRFMDKDHNEATIVIAVQKQPNTNTLQVIKNVTDLLPEVRRALPGSAKLTSIFDKSEHIQEAVHDVEFTLLVAFLLVVVVIFFYLGKPLTTIIPSLALPISVIGTFIVMKPLGYSIDILSMLAITLSIGFLIDDAIVVLENIERHIEMGKDPVKAALDGSKQISFTILSMTLCLASVFIPMLFMGGALGKLFREFAVVIAVAVLISGVVSLTLTPMLCAKYIKPAHRSREKNRLEKMADAINHSLLQVYEKWLDKALRHKPLILLGGVVSLFASGYLLTQLPKDFLPTDDLGFIQIFTKGPDSVSPFQMTQYQNEISQIVNQDPNSTMVVSVSSSPTPNKGFLFDRLLPLKQRPPIGDVIRNLKTQFQTVPGVQVFMRPIPLIDLQVGTSASQGDYQYTLLSLEPKDLIKSALEMVAAMQNLPGFNSISSNLEVELPTVSVKILRDRAALLKVSAGAIENVLKLAYSTSNLSPINEPENQYYVIMETLPDFYARPENLNLLYVANELGQLVPLSTVVEITRTASPLSVNHLDGMPAVTITFNLEGVVLGTALESLDALAKKILPPTVTGSVQGTANVFVAAFADLYFLLLITFFVVYIILGILYENLLHPITVMSTLPPAALGGLLTLVAFNYPLSLYAFIGIILLLGIVMKNGIILVDFAIETIYEKKMTPLEAIRHSCLIRFRPILMTTIAAMMGALPIALGIGGMTALTRIPLGLVIVGGLIFSQILTMFFTPVVFYYLEVLRERAHGIRVSDETPKMPS